MSKELLNQETPIARRDLLRVGATFLGSSALGILPALASAQGLVTSRADAAKTVTPIKSNVTIGYWNGGRFVPAEGLASGDSSLERVLLTITSLGAGGIQSIDAHANVPGVGKTPFGIWVAPPAGLERSRAYVLPDADGAVSLAVKAAGIANDVRLVTTSVAGAKLREGTYVLTAGKLDLNGLTMDPAGALVTRLPLAAAVLLIRVERA